MEQKNLLLNRENEREIFINNIQMPLSSHSKMIAIEGDSGTGKTHFIKNVLCEILDTNPEYYSCYINIENNEINISSVFEILTYYSWNYRSLLKSSLIQVPKSASFSDFLKKSKFKKKAAEKIFTTLKKTIRLLPVYGTVLESVMPFSTYDSSEPLDICNLFFSYIMYIAKKHRVIITIDNYQFLNENFRTKTEALIDEVKKNICLVIINRTINGDSTIRSLLCFSQNQVYLKMKNFSIETTKQYMRVDFANLINEDVIKRVFRITSGNPKLIELASRNFLFSINQKISIDETVFELSEAINNLPDIEKYVLTISSFFPAGLRTMYLIDIMKKVIASNDSESLKLSLSMLVSLGYININSTRGDLIKPTHEKIISIVKEVINIEEYSDIYNGIIIGLENIIDNNNVFNETEYDYLLSCLISMFSINQLKSKLSYVIKLIDRFYSSFLYNYITSFYSEMKDKEILTLLPEITIHKILDSFQKTSMFYEGIEAISILKNHNIYDEVICLYYGRFLTQTYDFKAALDVFNKLPESTSVLLHKINVLQHLEQNEEVMILIDKPVNSLSVSVDEYYIILRNTAHLFDIEKAINNLMTALDYFQKTDSLFPLATIFNNLGVVYIWSGNFAKAENYLNKSIKIFREIGSNELFESLFNYSVLLAAKGKYEEAEAKANEALIILPQVLWMDVLILKINIIIFQLLSNKISVKESYLAIKELVPKVKRSLDPWVRDFTFFNLASLGKMIKLPSSETPSTNFYENVYSKDKTRFDLIIKAKFNNEEIDMLLALSPNWRY